MAKLVICADAHLDASTAGVQRFDDVAAALDETVAAAIDWKADAWIFLGDLCNPGTSRSHRAVAYICRIANRLSEAGIYSVYLAANHDVIEDGHGASVLEPLKEMTGSATVEPDVIDRPLACDVDLGFWAVFLPFTPRSHAYDPAEFIAEAAAEYAECGNEMPVLILGHLNVEGITPGSEATELPRGRDIFWPMEAIAEHFPDALCVGGHIHKGQEWQTEGCPTLHIVGSLERLTFGEETNQPAWLQVEIGS